MLLQNKLILAIKVISNNYARRSIHIQDVTFLHFYLTSILIFQQLIKYVIYNIS